MVNFGLLAAEIVSLVWGTPANFIISCFTFFGILPTFLFLENVAKVAAHIENSN